MELGFRSLYFVATIASTQVNLSTLTFPHHIIAPEPQCPNLPFNSSILPLSVSLRGALF